MNKNNREEIFAGVLLDDTTIFTIQEICQYCDIAESMLVEMVEHGLVESSTTTTENIVFTLPAVRRVKSATRLHHDFNINMQGIALVLELVDELEKAHQELAILRKHL